MAIKLVRVDGPSDSKNIILQDGKHIIGRGKLLDCQDKRVSRQHGELVVNKNSITIRALHENPCFFTLKGSTVVKIILIGISKTFSNGDRFGLLPENFWFEINELSEDVESGSPNKELKSTEECLQEPDCSESSTLNANRLSEDDLTAPNVSNDETFNDNSRPGSPSLLSTVTGNSDEMTQINQNEPISNTNESAQPEINGSEEPNQRRIKEENECNEPNVENGHGSSKMSPIKRSHSPDSYDVKKIKTENITVKIDPDDVKPGPSDLAAAANANDGAANDKPNKPRERCIYGEKCYRRNPQHQAQFSHPRDADWGVGERGECPYGAACCRRDPRHWRSHHHPPGVLPPPQPGQTKIHKKKDPDVLPVQNIVTGKRIRRAVQKDNNCGGSGSDSEPDPYGTDESDEWEPGSLDYSEDC